MKAGSPQEDTLLTVCLPAAENTRLLPPGVVLSFGVCTSALALQVSKLGR